MAPQRSVLNEIVLMYTNGNTPIVGYHWNDGKNIVFYNSVIFERGTYKMSRMWQRRCVQHGRNLSGLWLWYQGCRNYKYSQ